MIRHELLELWVLEWVEDLPKPFRSAGATNAKVQSLWVDPAGLEQKGSPLRP